MNRQARNPYWRGWLLVAATLWMTVAPAVHAAGLPRFFAEPASVGGEGSSAGPGLHIYLYANANPIMGFDPSGNYTLVGTMGAAFSVGTLARIVVVAYIGLVAAELPFRAWTIYAGLKFAPLHAYLVAKHKDGDAYRIEINIDVLDRVDGPWKHPFKHYEGTLVERKIPFVEAFSGPLSAPVGRLSELTFRWWHRQMTGQEYPPELTYKHISPFDYVWAYNNCSTFVLLGAAKASLYTAFPF